MPIDLADFAPQYARIAAVIADRIEDGRYPAGSLLPSEKDLAAEFQVSTPTVRQSLAALRSRGYVTSHHGIGSRAQLPAEHPSVG